MKNTKKLIIIAWIVSTLIVLVNINISNAADNAKIELSADKTQILAGDKVVVTVKVTNITGIEDGILGLSGNLSYDNTKFENVTLAALNNWDKPEYNAENGKFVTLKGDPVKSDEAIFTISLVAKSDVKLGDTKIELTNLQVSDINTEYEIANGVATIKVTEKKQEQQPDNDTNTNTNTNTNTDINNNSSISKNNTEPINNVVEKNTVLSNQNSNTTYKGVLPKTGLFGDILVVGGSILLIIGVFCLVKYNRYKEI